MNILKNHADGLSNVYYNKDFYEKILENSHDEIFVTDGNGVTIYCNNTFEKNYGLKRSEIIGKKVWLLQGAKFKGECPIPLVLSKKKQITIEQETYTGKKLIVTATPVFDGNNNIEMIVENARDITELKNITYNLESTQKLMKKYKTELDQLRKKELDQINELVFKSSKMKELIKVINKIAPVDINTLILGESGTGKSALAKYMHKISTRKDGPFITINCTTIPEHLLESELFGYSSGAFTGAKKEGKIGLVELADEGTLFIDEIGELPLNLQAKFLELIQDHHYTPIGSVRPKKVNIKIISATNCDLAQLVKEKKFREDLYYRLKVVELNIPPLRERSEDIASLIYFFLNKYDEKYKFSHKISEECINILTNYSWPGNIRELQHIIEQLVVTVSDIIIETKHLPSYINQDLVSQSFKELVPLNVAIENLEKQLILQAYNQLVSSYKVAEALGISQSSASRKLRKYLKVKE